METLIPPRVPGVGVTVSAAAAAGARVAARGESMGAPPMTTGEGVSSGLTADTGEGVEGWATAVGSAVGVLVGEGVLSGAGVGTDVFGDVG